jgi:hypothetical protein
VRLQGWTRSALFFLAGVGIAEVLRWVYVLGVFLASRIL